MSDATDRTAALARLTLLVQPTVEPTLTTTPTTGEVDVILDSHKIGSRWVTATALNIGDVIFPTVRNGHRYEVITAGTTTTEPVWPTSSVSTITLGAEFQEIGPDSANVYDVRAAARECWELKAAKATEFISSQDSGSEQMIFDHCVSMAQKYMTPMVA